MKKISAFFRSSTGAPNEKAHREPLALAQIVRCSCAGGYLNALTYASMCIDLCMLMDVCCVADHHSNCVVKACWREYNTFKTVASAAGPTD